MCLLPLFRFTTKKASFLIILMMSAAISGSPSNAEAAATLVRDAEIEQTLRMYTDPLLISAGIAPKNVRIFVVQDDSLNAFVAGGMNIFVNTGLMLETSKPSMLLGVIAHEIGHISGAHLSQMSEKTDRATLGSVLGMVLGAAIMASGSPDAGAGVIAGSQSMSMRNLLSDVRGNEEAADQAALTYLDANGISASGMLEVFDILRRKQTAQDKKADPYLQTHPLTTSRISVVRNHLQMAQVPIDSAPALSYSKHKRLLARLRGYLWTPEQTLLFYPETDTSFAADYARAIAFYRMSNLPRARQILNRLISDNQNDPFLHDTLGQMYYESGYPKAAALQYKEAIRLLPDSALILTELARTLIVIGDPAYIREALRYLEQSVHIDDSNQDSWRLMATAYGKLNDNGMAYVALAQEAALKGETKNAIAYADNALQSLPELSAGAQLARDIKTASERYLIKQKEGKLF
jgi:predicted Zn-dependent protease